MNLYLLLGGMIAAGGMFIAGFFYGQHVKDVEIRADITEQNRVLEKVGSRKALEHATTVRRLANQLGEKRVALYGLTTGSDCLSADAVRLLNDRNVPAAPGESASATGAAATDRDVGNALALCRSRYQVVSDQLNQILDIDEVRSSQH